MEWSTSLFVLGWCVRGFHRGLAGQHQKSRRGASRLTLGSETWVLGLIAVTVLGACSVGCSRSPLMMHADKSYDGRTINLRVGDGVKVTLAENPTTGYKWDFLAKPEPVCVIVADAYVANTAVGTVGAGGVHTWEFRAVDNGTATVGLAYRRPWEKDAAPAQTFTLTLVVK